ncbi:hypothetical protein [Pedobacter jeongneungensis]|uniref:hypothetical protein n=1 Tax=Pedobacter jeongneungensis TaxID=947309 RepID=UPI000469E378|nr:hypothetical protein [Pedobacter jeongneungensis]
MKTNQARFLLLFCILNLIFISLSAQSEYDDKNKYVILNLDDTKSDVLGYTFFKTSDSKGKTAYILNIRYKTDDIRRKYNGEKADFIFTFYIFPGKDKLAFFKVNDTNTIVNYKLKDINELEKYLLDDRNNRYYEFEPVIKINNMYLQFAHNEVFGQAFSLIADHKYFPQYTRFSNKFQLNLFDKPYTEKYMDSIRKETINDTTTLAPFDLFLDYDKWYISKIYKQKGIINYWTNLKPIEPNGYSFGRITSEITYKINTGITDFVIYPSTYDLSKEYFSKEEDVVRFNFQQAMDLKKYIMDRPLVKQPKKVVKPPML